MNAHQRRKKRRAEARELAAVPPGYFIEFNGEPPALLREMSDQQAAYFESRREAFEAHVLALHAELYRYAASLYPAGVRCEWVHDD